MACSRVGSLGELLPIAAVAEQPAVAVRWWVAVPYRPVADSAREQLQQSLARARGRSSWQAHYAAAERSLALSGQIQSALAGAGIDSYLLDGVQTLALL